MRVMVWLVAAFLLGCAAKEPEVHNTSVDVDMSRLPVLLAAVNTVAGNRMDVDELVAFTESVRMDDEKQEIYPVTYKGSDAELYYHVWREQQDWVHLYISSPSEGLVKDIESVAGEFARPAEP